MTNLVSRRRHLASAAFFLILIFVFAQARAQKKDSAGSVLQPDKGKFSVVLEGKTIGHEEFEIAPTGAGWLARGTTTLKSDKGADTKVTGNLMIGPHKPTKPMARTSFSLTASPKLRCRCRELSPSNRISLSLRPLSQFWTTIFIINTRSSHVFTIGLSAARNSYRF